MTTIGPGEVALQLAASGWKVIPIWGLVARADDGSLMCACGNVFCTAPGKHPLITMGRGLANASSDPGTVAGWWDTWPMANIAVACGAASGVVVVDCDVDDEAEVYGDFELKAWGAAVGLEIPSTLSQETGSGGTHMFFEYPQDGIGVKNVVSWLDRVDVKSDGGYVLVPPSMHVSGRQYRWHEPLVQPVPMPTTMLNAIRSARSRVGSRGGGAPSTDTPVYDYKQTCRTGPRAGYRDHFFNARAFELRRSGVDWAKATSDITRLWHGTEQPAGKEFPLDAALRKLARVWEEIEPEPIPDWDPLTLSASSSSTNGSHVQTDGRPYDLATDLGNAWRFVQQHRDKLRWSNAAGWFMWDGKRWAPDSNDGVQELAAQTVDSLFTDAVTLMGDNRDVMLTWARKSSARPRVEAMVKLTSAYRDIKVDMAALDADPFLLSVNNGTLDLCTGELRPPRAEDMISQMSHVDYDPSCVDPRWDRFIYDATCGDAELADYIRRAAGYTLTGSVREEMLFMIFGPTASGKTTFVTALTTLLGDYAMSTPPETLMQKRNGGTSETELARMRGKRFVSSVEPKYGDRFAEGLIKQMTGGDRMIGRHLYRGAFEFDATHKLWIASNIKPRANMDDALFRRFHLIPFPITLPPDRRDTRVKQELGDPGSTMARAALAWSVRGCLEWQSQGLGTCTVVDAHTRQYRDDEDTIGTFISTAFAHVPGSMVSVLDAYHVYQGWANEFGERGMPRRLFIKALEERNVIRTPSDDFFKDVALLIAAPSIASAAWG